VSKRDERPAANAGRILLVEDSASARRLLQELLLRLGAPLPNLRLASTVAEAGTVFEQWHPNLAFVDVELGPGPPVEPKEGVPFPRNGVELARQFLCRDPALRVILSTAAAPSDERILQLRREFPVEVVVKPLLAGRVNEVLARTLDRPASGPAPDR